MSPAELRAMVGKVVTIVFPAGNGPAWRVLGFGLRDVRVRSLHSGQVSTLPLDTFAAMLDSRALRVRAGRATDRPTQT